MTLHLTKNQYIHLNLTLLPKIKIIQKSPPFNYSTIEDIDIDNTNNKNPNVLVYTSNKQLNINHDHFINIFHSVNILITTKNIVDNSKYKFLPNHIQYIIIDNIIYNRHDDFEIMFLMSKTDLENYVQNIITFNDSKINELNKNNMSILHIAIQNNISQQIIQSLIYKIKNNIIFNSYYYDNQSLLMKACQNKLLDVIVDLIPSVNNETLNKIDIYDCSVLHYACQYSLDSIAIELIQRLDNKILNVKNNIKNTAIVFCIINDLSYVFDYLLNLMSNYALNYINNNSESLIHIACNHNRKDMAIKLINKINNKYTLNTLNKYKETTIFCACKKNMEDVAMLLLPHITDENIKIYTTNQMSLLDIVCENKMEKIALEILPKFNIRNMDYKLILYRCAVNNMENVMIEIINMLDTKIIINYILHKNTITYYLFTNRNHNVLLHIVNKLKLFDKKYFTENYLLFHDFIIKCRNYEMFDIVDLLNEIRNNNK